MKENRPRKSHYLPKFYLAGFTASGKVDDNLYVLDQASGRDWTSSPAKAATERDLYVVDLGPSENPDMVEKCLGNLEGDFASVVRGIIERQQLPTGDDFNWFLNFVALMVARIPRTRKVVAQVVDRKSKDDLLKQLATREGWNQFREVCGSAGHKIADDEYEEFKRVASSEDYTADFDQTTHVQMMVKQMMDALLPDLAKRNWSLGIAADEAPDLICSDFPVGVWPAKSAELAKPITLQSPNTVLSFPITRRLIAIARYERQCPVLGIIPQGIAMFNTWTLFQARQVFSPAPDFTYRRFDGTIGGKADLLEFHRRRLGGT